MKAISYILSFVCLFFCLSVSQAGEGEFKKIQWIDLLPEKDLQALMEEPDPISILEGSAADSISSSLSMEIKDPVTEYERALMSFNVRKEFNNQKINIPGFIVPVETTEDGKTTGFFLVPFFGACLHLPPPPPNQIIYVTSKEGIKMDEIFEAYWVEGTIFTKPRYNDTANSAYSMTLSKFYMFKEGDTY